GQTRAIGNNTYVHAKPVRRMTINNQGNCVWQNANRYQFRFRLPAEQVTIVKTAPVGAGKYFVNTTGLSCGKTYEVDVRASFDGGSTWCHSSDPYGQVCLFTTDACAGGLIEEPGSDDAPSLIEARMQLCPNPADGGQVAIRIDGETRETVFVEMRDATGKLVLARNFPHQEGAFQAVLETTSLRTGLYLVAVRSGSTLLVERLMVP
ncbi:MAG TPA: T9SS type A sorting domain-containing protein, partial [Flavobacteriales bacterium]|nr:T9SS type A sorting domain-containing protein [Flavobacteriales bacterium]